MLSQKYRRHVAHTKSNRVISDSEPAHYFWGVVSGHSGTAFSGARRAWAATATKPASTTGIPSAQVRPTHWDAAPITTGPTTKPRKPRLATRPMAVPARPGLRSPAAAKTCGAMQDRPAPRQPKPI